MSIGNKNELNKIIYRDDLTGILNKRFFLEIHKFINEQDIFLSIFDIDDFKYINDSFGHYCGDAVIRELSVLIECNIQKDIYALRYGGDEFIIIFVKKDKQTVYDWLDNLRYMIENHKIYIKNDTIVFTCSFGVSFGNIKDKNQLLEKADIALYVSKNEGKNRINFYNKDLKKENYFPVFIERQIKNSIAKHQNCIIKGSFQSGKKELANRLKKYVKKYNIYCLETTKIQNIKEPFILCYNPVIINNDNYTAKVFYDILQKYNPKIFNLYNYNRQQIINLCIQNNIKPTLLLINFIDLISSGNIGILKYIFQNKNHFHIDLFDIEKVQAIISLLSDDTLRIIKSILHFGIRFSKKTIINSNINYDFINYLVQLMILENRNDYFLYTYPPIYFYLKLFHQSNIQRNKDYEYLLELINSIKEFENYTMDKRIDIIKKIYDYGDIYFAQKYMNKISAHTDKAKQLLTYMHIENMEIKQAREIVCSIEDTKIKKHMNMLINIKMHKNVKIKDYNNIPNVLLYCNYLLANNDMKKIENIINNINDNQLNDKENISYLSILAEIYYRKGDFKNALRCYKHALSICKRKHYISKYGKILMKIAILFDETGEYKKALDYILRALSIINLCESSDARLSAHLNLSVIYAHCGNFEKAIEVLSQLLLYEHIEYKTYFRAYILHNLSEIYLLWWKKEKSMQYIKQAIELFKEINIEIPIYMKILSNKINLLFNKTIFVLDINENMDKIDKSDIRILEFLINNKNYNADFIINNIKIIAKDTGLNNNYMLEILCYTALYYENNKELKNALLNGALQYLDKKNQIMRYREIKKLMEAR